MNVHHGFRVEPWALHETTLNLDALATTESLFALSNGFMGMRGNLDEGEPFGTPGSYLSGVYELRPLPSAESQYGTPESGQTIVNVTNGKLIRLLVDDEPFDVRYGKLVSHERVLDLRSGLLRRTAEWCSPAGRGIRVTSTRLVSFTHRAIMAIAYEVEPLDGRMNAVVQSELVANEAIPHVAGDPRSATPSAYPLISEEHGGDDTRALLIHRTQESHLRIGAGMDHVIEGTDVLRVLTETWRDSARVNVVDDLEPGRGLRIVKFVAYGWSSTRSQPAMRDQVAAALLAARTAGWDQLVAQQRAYLDEFWASADVEVEGDVELQQAVRFALFQVMSAGARTEGRAIGAKGLTGSGYDGHSFWDTDFYVLPVLAYTAPDAAKGALTWRHSTLATAKERARHLGLAGASYPWRTIHGEECSGYWPAGTAAFHINADIAAAVMFYVRATADESFEREFGVELLVETARLWQSLGHHDRHGGFRIDGVTGPDEYTAVVDNNIFTNLMAQRNLNGAADACERHPDRAVALGVTPEEMAAWRAAAENVVIPYDEELGVHQQSEGFTHHEAWDFAATPAENYPLLLHYPYFELYRKQVVKQPDLVLAMHLFANQFPAEQRARNFDYYERITVRDSSLSACTEAIAAADAGYMRLAFDYAGEAGLVDLHDLHGNTSDGLHIASLAGVWLAFVRGFGGMRDFGESVTFNPRLPDALVRLAFSIRHRGRCLRVEVTGKNATYALTRGDGTVQVTHHGERLSVGSEPVVRPIPPTTERPAPKQPAGREPRHRKPD
jgi:alpha,alpha-trehalose phosphorylase